jgi:quinohemoprotein ethanol dehydrogenase
MATPARRMIAMALLLPIAGASPTTAPARRTAARRMIAMVLLLPIAGASPTTAPARRAVACGVLAMALFVPLAAASANPTPAAGAAPPTPAAGAAHPTPTAGAAPPAAAVDAARLQAADAEPQNWYTGGRDQGGTYYSPLATINAANVKDLGFAWSYDLGSPLRGQEATPIVVDGIMYTSGTWGYVYAVNAATGREVWRYDPHSDFQAGRNPCCDLVNRGVAVWQGKVYVAAGDGRLHAIDAATGGKVWDADTIVDHTLPYASSGAPQIAGNVVIIGNGGADIGHGGVRGYVSAYDLNTGRF